MGDLLECFLGPLLEGLLELLVLQAIRLISRVIAALRQNPTPITAKAQKRRDLGLFLGLSA